jgi:hypothetical protein
VGGEIHGQITADQTDGIYINSATGNIQFKTTALSTNNWNIKDENGNAMMRIFNGGTTIGVNIESTHESTSITTGGLIVAGGVGIAKKLCVGSTVDSTSSTTGSVLITGGVGIAKNLRVGSTVSWNNVVQTTLAGWTRGEGYIPFSTGSINISKVNNIVTFAQLTLIYYDVTGSDATSLRLVDSAGNYILLDSSCRPYQTQICLCYSIINLPGMTAEILGVNVLDTGYVTINRLNSSFPTGSTIYMYPFTIQFCISSS